MTHKQPKLADQQLFRTQCYLDGHWVNAASGEHFAVNNPATRKLLAQVPKAGATETRQAIEAAERALPAWRAKTAQERAAYLRRWFELLLQHQDDLAKLMTLEQGKPLAEAAGEIRYAASFIEWFAEEGKRAYGEIIPSPKSDQRLFVIKQAVGVCAAITPWNFPAAMITRKAAPALAAGCTLVVKPAEDTPLTAFALAELAHRAGIPAGVFNVLTGTPSEIGAELCANPTVRKLSFTGSTAVGRILMAQCAADIKKLSLELGGNAPFLVFDDADIDAAVEGAVASKYRNSGQTCVCTNRFYVHQAVYDSFADKLAKASAQLKVGNGLEPDVVQGPLINEAALTKVSSLVNEAIADGAKVLCGGQALNQDGLWYLPTVLSQVKPEMRIVQEEIFGPVATLIPFNDDAEVIELANGTPYGLAAYFYSNNLARIWRIAEALEFGMIGINTGLISNEVAPFGGVKQSGLGREGSRHGLDEYLELKYLALAGL